MGRALVRQSLMCACAFRVARAAAHCIASPGPHREHLCGTGRSPAIMPRVDLASLPYDVMLEIIRALGKDIDTIVSLVVTCKAWGDLSRTPAFWATVLSSFGFDAPRVIAMEPQRAREEAHKFFCERCYVCFERTPERVVTIRELMVRLCRGCRDEIAEIKDLRLVSTNEAMSRHRLRKEHLADLPYAVTSNPINPSWDPMRVYRRRDVVARKWEVQGELIGATRKGRRKGR